MSHLKAEPIPGSPDHEAVWATTAGTVDALHRGPARTRSSRYRLHEPGPGSGRRSDPRRLARSSDAGSRPRAHLSRSPKPEESALVPMADIQDGGSTRP